MTAMSIISVLAAISIPQFQRYKMRAFNATAQSDLRSAVTAEEAIYSDSGSYRDCANVACETILQDYVYSDGVQISVVTRDDASEFKVTSSHGQGDTTYEYDSEDQTLSEL